LTVSSLAVLALKVTAHPLVFTFAMICLRYQYQCMADEHSRSGTPLFDVQKAQDDSLPVSHRPRIEVHRKLYLSYSSVKFGLEEGQVTQKQLAL